MAKQKFNKSKLKSVCVFCGSSLGNNKLIQKEVIKLAKIISENNLELVYARIFSAYGEGQNSKNFYPSLKLAALNGKDFKII